MTQAYIGTIIQVGFNFAPRNWAQCNGQLISIAQNTALFALLGTTYGGNGQTTFALPDLRGRTPIHTGQGPGLSSYSLGQRSGVESTTLLSSNLPAHTHTASMTGLNAATTKATLSTPVAGAVLGRSVDTNSTTAALPVIYCPAGTATSVTLGAVTLAAAGNSQPVSVIQPTLSMNYIICQFGIFPSRN
jgi:microcystin-dependent protein